MKRIMVIIFCLCLSAFLLASEVSAGGFNLKSIGNLNTEGKEISHWWYSGSSPVLVGEAGASSSVTVNVDGTEESVTADESGNWSYNPGSLSDGDHSIVLTNNGSTITFTLTMGAENVDWAAVESGTGEALPAAGNPLPTILMLSGAMLLFLLGKRYLV